MSKHLIDSSGIEKNYDVIHTPRKRGPGYLLTDDEFEDRQRICGECDYLTDNGICRKCGCSQMNKSRIRNVHCPIEKW